MRCYMDQTANPCHKFYEYACGRWEAYHPIPKDRVGYDIFEILREVSQNIINRIEYLLCLTIYNFVRHLQT